MLVNIISFIVLILFLCLYLFCFVKLKGFHFTIFFNLSLLLILILYAVSNIFIALTTYIMLFIVLKIYSVVKIKRNNTFSTYFGVPGSGKTTVAAWLVRKAKKHKKKHNVYSNVPILGAYAIEKSDIGKYMMSDGLLILDECGTEFDNRNYKSNFTQEQVKFFKYHRHYNLDVACFSQFWNDIDIKLRNLSTNLFLLKPSIVPFFVCRRRIKKKIGINKDTKEIQDQFEFVPFSGYYFFAPSVWNMFKTHARDELPLKSFDVYSSD